MAGDGRETVQNDDKSSWIIIRDNCVKVWKLPDGGLFGAAHGSECIERLRLALVNNHPAPKLDDVAGLLVKPNGTLWLYEGSIWQPLTGFKYYAVGSGAIHAWTAMDAGKSAREAVRLAMRRDMFSGGKITAVHLNKSTASQRKRRPSRQAE
jgi:hypothetical protein